MNTFQLVMEQKVNLHPKEVGIIKPEPHKLEEECKQLDEDMTQT